MFKGGIRDNGTYDPYVPKNDPLDVLIAGRFGAMNEKQCHESCPLYPEMCSDCAARYWCLCNSVKRDLHTKSANDPRGDLHICYNKEAYII